MKPHATSFVAMLIAFWLAVQCEMYLRCACINWLTHIHPLAVTLPSLIIGLRSRGCLRVSHSCERF
ncbi:hypothetical protein [Providencia sp.]|uniref:hypothetical protein n=1 Tax=Providencia sp. TaxID=589 RepID=UPI0025EEB671|nr:hypothetical protein [Providencia sp.]